MTVSRLQKEITLEEACAWSAYFNLKSEREEKAYEDEKKKAQYRKLR
tara:strand:- start:354 stop:494 length:141 start_codon:yes stop_codon:yes gene_type:complete